MNTIFLVERYGLITYFYVRNVLFESITTYKQYRNRLKFLIDRFIFSYVNQNATH